MERTTKIDPPNDTEARLRPNLLRLRFNPPVRDALTQGQLEKRRKTPHLRSLRPQSSRRIPATSSQATRTPQPAGANRRAGADVVTPAAIKKETPFKEAPTTRQVEPSARSGDNSYWGELTKEAPWQTNAAPAMCADTGQGKQNTRSHDADGRSGFAWTAPRRSPLFQCPPISGHRKKATPNSYPCRFSPVMCGRSPTLL